MMRRSRKRFLLFLIVILFAFSLAMLIHSFYIIELVQVKEMDVYAASSATGSFNLDKDKLHFGKSALGGYRKSLFINKFDDTMKVVLSSSGTMGDWITYGIDDVAYENKLVFYLEPGEEEFIYYYLDIPEEYRPSEGETLYTGETKIVWKKKIFLDDLF